MAHDAPLQFETAIPRGVAVREAVTTSAVTCLFCTRAITGEYFDINGQVVCDTCRARVEQQSEPPRGIVPVSLATLYGLGAAIAGAILHYILVKVTHIEFALATIAIGYMVGYSVRKGTSGRGGRLFQVIAIVLTYWSVGLAYLPLVISETSSAQETTPSALSSQPAPTVSPAPPAEARPTATKSSGRSGFLYGVAMLILLTLALPTLSVVSSLPSGLLSAAIIGFGMHQAWRMTGRVPLMITGPFRVGAVEPTPS